MAAVRWNKSIKQILICEIGSYLRLSRFSALLQESVINDVEKIDQITKNKLIIVVKLLFVIVMNVDDQNAGNKTEIIKYIDTLKKVNESLRSRGSSPYGGYLGSRIEGVISFISDNMLDKPNLKLILPMPQIVNVHVGLSLVKITSYASGWISFPFFTS